MLYASSHIMLKYGVHCVQSANRDSCEARYDSVTKRESQKVTEI